MECCGATHGRAAWTKTFDSKAQAGFCCWDVRWNLDKGDHQGWRQCYKGSDMSCAEFEARKWLIWATNPLCTWGSPPGLIA